MPNEPSISILLPVYNAEPFLAVCLDSILRQTTGDWELLAVDDFSQDRSLELLQQYAQRDRRIQVLTNREKGIIPALRRAFARSKGAFITRMDADDKMAPDKLEALRKTVDDHGTGVVATGFVEYFSDTELGDGYRRYANWLNILTADENNYTDIYRECVLPSPCWMVSREDLVRCGAFDSDTYPEDYDLCFRFYQNNLRVASVKKVLHYWRDHDGRTSRNDPKYADVSYFDLKLQYFLEIDHHPQRPLVLWGAGTKGKRLARMLASRNLNFRWLCNNPQKWDVPIYGIPLFHTQSVEKLTDPQVIVAVSNPEEQGDIDEYLEELHLKRGRDYFFFC